MHVAQAKKSQAGFVIINAAPDTMEGDVSATTTTIGSINMVEDVDGLRITARRRIQTCKAGCATNRVLLLIPLGSVLFAGNTVNKYMERDLLIPALAVKKERSSHLSGNQSRDRSKDSYAETVSNQVQIATKNAEMDLMAYWECAGIRI